MGIFRCQLENMMSNGKGNEAPAFAEAPARRTRLWEAGLRAGRRIVKLKMTFVVVDARIETR
jgi:hypothetical protein